MPDVAKRSADAAKLRADSEKLRADATSAWTAADVLLAHAKLHLSEGARLVAAGTVLATVTAKPGKDGAKDRGNGAALRDAGAKELAEGNKLMAEVAALREADEGAALWAAGNKLLADADAIMVEVDDYLAGWSKLVVDGDKLWDEAISGAFGKLSVEWRWNDPANAFDAALANGELYVAVTEPPITADVKVG